MTRDPKSFEAQADGVASAIFSAYNEADHVDNLVQSARVHSMNGDYAECLNWLRLAKKPASSVESRVDTAIRYVEDLIRDFPNETKESAQ